MPSGQITEQYTLPNVSVSINNSRTTPTFNASTAGKNWILAIQPNQACMVPVKSRNKSVIRAKKITATDILSLRNIFALFRFVLPYLNSRRFATTSYVSPVQSSGFLFITYWNPSACNHFTMFSRTFGTLLTGTAGLLQPGLFTHSSNGLLTSYPISILQK